MPARKKPDEVTVPLIAPHEHAGRQYQAGDPLTVRRSLLPVLERFGAIEPQQAASAEPEPSADSDTEAGEGGTDGDAAPDADA